MLFSLQSFKQTSYDVTVCSNASVVQKQLKFGLTSSILSITNTSVSVPSRSFKYKFVFFLEINMIFTLNTDGITFLHWYELSFQNPILFYIYNVIIFSLIFLPYPGFCAGSFVTVSEVCVDQGNFRWWLKACHSSLEAQETV